jgi:hypothetical protein
MTNRDPLGYLESLYVSRLNTKRVQLKERQRELAGQTDVISAHARTVIDGRLGQIDLDLMAFRDALDATRGDGEPEPKREWRPPLFLDRAG